MKRHVYRYPGWMTARRIAEASYLTRRRALLLALLAYGLSREEIARVIYTSVSNAHQQLIEAKRVLGGDSFPHTVMIAIDAGYFRFGRAGYAGPDLQTCGIDTLRKEMLGED